MARVFISYAREDKDFVDTSVRKLLDLLNIQVWIDTDSLHGGERWQETIQRAMPHCDFFLLIVTPKAAASPAVRGEVEWILRHRPDRLIPVLAQPSRLNGIHPELPQIHHIDCVNRSPSRVAALLAQAFFHLAANVAEQAEKRQSELTAELERLTEDAQQRECEWREELDASRGAIAELNAQLDQVLTFDGDWRDEPRGEVAPFVPREQRSAPIIAVMNVKGGVGKSTLAANLAATWWGADDEPKRVLLIDLDFQQSVSSLCLSARDLGDLNAGNLFVNALFDERVSAGDHLLRSMRRVGRGQGYVIAANESLTRIETQMMARWLTGQTRKDVRYLLRELLHGPIVQERFDAVIIDCPPRIQTACINALAAADFLLVPVLLDLTSAESVPRLLGWARHYAHAGICPELEILGVVANKKSDRRAGLLIREETIWRELPDKCRVQWQGEVPFCSTIIPNSSAIAEHAQTPGRFACEDQKLRPIFTNLARELEKRLNAAAELTA